MSINEEASAYASIWGMRLLTRSSNAGKSTSVESIRKARHIERSMPMLAIPLCAEKARLPALISMVRVLSSIARAVLVFSILPSAGGSV